jgi:hypothetical protein
MLDLAVVEINQGKNAGLVPAVCVSQQKKKVISTMLITRESEELYQKLRCIAS